MKLKNLGVAAALAAVLAPVFAAPTLATDWGTHSTAGEVYVSPALSQGPLDQVITFNLLSSATTTAAAVSLSFLTYFNIASGAVQLFASNGDANYTNDTPLASFGFGANSSSYSFGNLAAGNYFYRVTGNIDGSLGGSYSVASSISPVPEPETYALLLAGLGVVGFIARRRRPE